MILLFWIGFSLAESQEIVKTDTLHLDNERDIIGGMVTSTESNTPTAQQLLVLMNSEGWRDTEIAGRLKVNAMTVFRWRHGKATPRYPVAVRRQLEYLRTEFGVSNTKPVTA